MAKKYINPGLISFSGKILRNTQVFNSSAWIEFPYDLKETFGVGNLVPINVIFDGKVKYSGSLAKMGGPKALIIIKKDIRLALGKEPGDTVQVKIELDEQPRSIPVPKDLLAALTRAGINDYFNKLAYSHRKEYISYIEEAKKPETRIKRIERTISMLQDKAK